MIIAAHHSMIGGGKRLPYDAEVEYIESTGTQWIDTGFRSNNTCKISVDMESKADYTAGWVFGSRNGTANAKDKSCLFMQVTNGNMGVAMFGSGIIEFDSSLIKNNRHIVEMSFAGGLVIDGAVVAPFTPSQQTEIFTNTFPMALFNMFNGSSLNVYFRGKIYGFSVESNGIPRLLFQPVRVGTTGYMFDRVSGQLFGNQGTGAFIVGSDV